EVGRHRLLHRHRHVDLRRRRWHVGVLLVARRERDAERDKATDTPRGRPRCWTHSFTPPKAFSELYLTLWQYGSQLALPSHIEGVPMRIALSLLFVAAIAVSGPA